MCLDFNQHTLFFYSAVHMLWSMVIIYMDLGQDSDFPVFYTAVDMLSSVVRIYMQLGQDSDIAVQVL